MDHAALKKLYIAHLVIAAIVTAGGVISIRIAGKNISHNEAEGYGMLVGMFGAVPFLVAVVAVVRYTIPAIKLQFQGKLADKRPLLLLIFPAVAILGMVLEPDGSHFAYEILAIGLPLGL